jgi:hypothetical protein
MVVLHGPLGAVGVIDLSQLCFSTDEGSLRRVEGRLNVRPA